MSKNNPAHIVVLQLPTQVAALILYGRHVVFVLTGNASYPSPNPTLAQVGTLLDNLESADAVAQTKAKGTAAARNAKKKLARNGLKGLAAYVQGVVDASNPDDGSALIASAGMFERRPSGYRKPFLMALMGPVPGEVLVRAKAVRSAAYEWQFSADGGKTWVSTGITRVAHTTMVGLTPLVTYLFRFRTTVSSVTGDWSQNISFLVH